MEKDKLNSISNSEETLEDDDKIVAPFIVIDLDQWIFDDGCFWHDRPYEMLEQIVQGFQSSGHNVCAASYRSINRLKPYLNGIQFDYYVLLDGACILDKYFHEMYVSSIETDTIDKLIQFCEKENYGLVLEFDDCFKTYLNRLQMDRFYQEANIFDKNFDSPKCQYHKDHRVLSAYICLEGNSFADIGNIGDSLAEDIQVRCSSLWQADYNKCYFVILSADSDRDKGFEKLTNLIFEKGCLA